MIKTEVKEEKKADEALPESPTSVTFSAISPKGYSVLLTVRDKELKTLVEKMDWIENWFDITGYKPQQQKGYPAKPQPKVVEGQKCPKCGGNLIEKTSKTGKTFLKCEHGKFNFATKQNEGCDYIKWL